MEQPRYSDDGKFYWDGQRWVPVPATAGPGKTHVVTHAAGWRWLLFWGFVIGFLVLAAIGSAMNATGH